MHVSASVTSPARRLQRLRCAASGDDERDWLAERAPAWLSQSERTPALLRVARYRRRQEAPADGCLASGRTGTVQ